MVKWTVMKGCMKKMNPLLQPHVGSCETSACATKMLDYLILNCHWSGWMTINWLRPKGFKFIGRIQVFFFEIWKIFKNNFHYRTFAVMLLIIFMFLQIEIVFIKWEQNQRWPPDAYINNDYMLQFKYDIEKTKN